jgi:hypothetical protein
MVKNLFVNINYKTVPKQILIQVAGKYHTYLELFSVL